MQQQLLLLFMLQVAGIKILFVKENATVDVLVAEPAAKITHQSQNLQLPVGSSYLADLPENLSKLVTLMADAMSVQNRRAISEETPIIVPIGCDMDWKYAKAVLQIVDGTEKELPSGMAETEEERTQLIKIYQALLIRDPSCTKRLVDALCVAEHAPAGNLELVTYLKMWLRVFCASCNICVSRSTDAPCSFCSPYCLCAICEYYCACSTMPDDFWLDLFKTLREQDPTWHLVIKDLPFILDPLDLARSRMLKFSSPFVKAILEFLEEEKYGLAIPCEYFFKGRHLAGRLYEVVDIVRCASSEDSVILISPDITPCCMPRPEHESPQSTLFEERHESLSIRIMKDRRLFVSGSNSWSPNYILTLINGLLSEPFGQVTDLFLSISPEVEKFWTTPVEDTMDVVSILASQPLLNLWIYSYNYTSCFVEETKQQLDRLKQANGMRNAEITIWEHRSLTENEIKAAEDAMFKPCGSCKDKNQPCFIDWFKQIEERTCKPSYVLPRIPTLILKEKPFMLASLTSTNAGMPPRMVEDSCLPSD